MRSPYERALLVEFGLQNIAWQQQPPFPIDYKGHNVGKFVPDIIAYGKIVIDTKTIPAITKHELGQMMTYLKVTKLPIGLILNFANPSLEFRRVVLSSKKKDKDEINLR